MRYVLIILLSIFFNFNIVENELEYANITIAVNGLIQNNSFSNVKVVNKDNNVVESEFVQGKLTVAEFQNYDEFFLIFNFTDQRKKKQVTHTIEIELEKIFFKVEYVTITIFTKKNRYSVNVETPEQSYSYIREF